jgi:hypothetical protein
MYRRNAGDSTLGVSTDTLIDFVVTTAETGVILEITISTNDKKQ